MWDAIVTIDSYNQTLPNYDDELFEVLARRCAKYSSLNNDIKILDK